MKKLLLFFIGTASSALYATPNGIALQQQISPLHNLLHVEIDLNNTGGETFDNVTVAVTLPEYSLYFLRQDTINSGSFGVTGDFFKGGQTVTWITGDSSQTHKAFHFIAFAHDPGTYQLTIQITDNQGQLHTYQSNSQELHFPHVENQVFVISKNSSLTFNGSDAFITTSPATTPIEALINPPPSFGSVTPQQTTVYPYTFTYTPDSNFLGYDYFTLQAVDSQGDADGESVLMVVGVENDPNGYTAFLRKTYNPEPEANAPGAKNFSLTYFIDGGNIPVYLIDYSLDLFNATLPVTYSIDTNNVTHGVASVDANGIFNYAAGSETGVDLISYRVTDANNKFADATITVNITNPT